MFKICMNYYSKSEVIWINHEFEKVIEKFKDFEKYEFEKYKPFESKMSEIETKMKELENENLFLKRNDSKKERMQLVIVQNYWAKMSF